MATSAVTNHLFIAGMGRAGTSFLVRYLDALGLDTIISRKGENSGWDANANAGLEQTPADDIYGAERPYVIKSPWLHEYIEELLNHPATKIDAVIMPVRNLTESAASRLILERRSMYQQHLWMSEMETTWESWGGSTPGGDLYSLNIVDEARIIAAGFYKIVELLTKRDIPMIFLHFPRFVEDGSYLFNKLQPILPAAATLEKASEAFRQTASKDQVRVGEELGASNSSNIPDDRRVDLIATRREINRLQKALLDAKNQLIPFKFGKLGWINRRAMDLSRLWHRPAK